MRRLTLLLALGGLAFAAPALAQDPAKVDPKHYKVLYENADVRVLRANYGPHEKSVMHAHPNVVAVFATDAHFKFTMADGTVQDRQGKKGDNLSIPAETHNPENVGDTAAEVIVVELKTPKK
jgi:quercetin dioxygenase-like cupin family protein